MGALEFDAFPQPRFSDTYSTSNILPDQRRGRPQILLPEWVEVPDSDRHFPLQEGIQGVAILLAQSCAFTP